MHLLILEWMKKNLSEELGKEIKVRLIILVEMIIVEKVDIPFLMSLNLQNNKKKFMFHNV